MSSNLKDYNYALPEGLIATEPLVCRDQSKLMVLKRSSGQIENKKFSDILEYFHEGDLLVLNDTKVFPARLIGYNQNGAAVEILLCKPVADGIWQALGKNLKERDLVKFDSSKLQAEIVSKSGREILVRFNTVQNLLWDEIEKIGQMPLPPYISKKNTRHDSFHRERYQTVFAQKIGSVAAPTAGLHFTLEIIEKLQKKGVIVEHLTLHVGLGTFLPVESSDVSQHKMHSEYYHVSKELIDKIIHTKSAGGRVISVGTTVCRAIETVFSEPAIAELLLKNTRLIASNALQSSMESKLEEVSDIFGETDIFIYPPYKFKCVDGLITNFHLPKSTLLMLVSAMAGREYILEAYQHAVKNGYRFYSYGDAMYIE
ncbi:MAG: S-adenosylmethionine:tRNA ribosyltransferase-isomerase [bacterium ADurb.Bin212]|nr:MAG: S-adenosylmethionine:tRNA ribosyltransferase-isomerase [bacterium ADurb.Bin212]